jgi:hypothetical protein
VAEKLLVGKYQARERFFHYGPLRKKLVKTPRII